MLCWTPALSKFSKAGEVIGIRTRVDVSQEEPSKTSIALGKGCRLGQRFPVRHQKADD